MKQDDDITQLIKKNCATGCGRSIKATKAHYEKFGNYCNDCSAKATRKSRFGRQDSHTAWNEGRGTYSAPIKPYRNDEP